jgi:hypothetical protein
VATPSAYGVNVPVVLTSVANATASDPPVAPGVATAVRSGTRPEVTVIGTRCTDDPPRPSDTSSVAV